MKCKIFTGVNGTLQQGLGQPLITLEDAINDFLKDFGGDAIQNVKIVQSQSRDTLTISIFY